MIGGSPLTSSSLPCQAAAARPSLTASGVEPTVGCTEAPTVGCTEAPTVGCTEAPTVGCTEAPTVGCTEAPTVGCADAPTVGCTEAPTVGCTEAPTVGCTEARRAPGALHNKKACIAAHALLTWCSPASGTCRSAKV